MDNESENEEIIRLLNPIEAIRRRSGMYIATTEEPTNIIREVVDNAEDEVGSGYGDTIIVGENLNGYYMVADNGRGISITWSLDKPEITSCELSITTLHSGSKFYKQGTTGQIGLHGLGNTCCSACSEEFIIMSKITEFNYDRSIPQVKDLWEKSVRSKKDLFYIIVTNKGKKVFESDVKLHEIEKKLNIELPKDMSTIVLFKPDSTIFDTTQVPIPTTSLYYFLLIQQKFYKKKNVKVYVNGAELIESYKPYENEVLKTIIPKDTSENPSVDFYITFEVDGGLGKPSVWGSINGLDCQAGFHINIAKALIKGALKSIYKFKWDDLLLSGMKIGVLCLASEIMFSSQTKENCKSITKVKPDDFLPVQKEIEKLIKKNQDYWDIYIEKLTQLAESIKSISAIEKAEKIMNSASGVNLYRSRSQMSRNFTDCTAIQSQRWSVGCELMICEGLSAAQSIVSGRPDTKKYACLALRGKVISAEGRTVDQVLDSEIIFNLFQCIGLGLDANNVLKDCQTDEEAYEIIKQKSRYQKICIATDSDPDGSAIFNELIHIFGKYSRFLIDCGLIYRVIAPLYKGTSKKTGNIRFYYPDDEFDAATNIPLDLDTSKKTSYLKGLGSIEKGDVGSVFFNENTRKLIRITPEGLDYMLDLNEDINIRKKLMFDKGILTNPYGFNDI